MKMERIVSVLEQPAEHVPVSLPDEVPSIPFDSNVTKEKFLKIIRHYFQAKADQV